MEYREKRGKKSEGTAKVNRPLEMDQDAVELPLTYGPGTTSRIKSAVLL
jgi:hypothetical protein